MAKPAPMPTCITWQAPTGETIAISLEQEQRLTAAGVWPRTSRGQEYCQVYKGATLGWPTLDDGQIDRIISDR